MDIKEITRQEKLRLREEKALDIRMRRIHLGMTLRALAQATGIHESNLTTMELGKMSIPKAKLARIEECLAKKEKEQHG